MIFPASANHDELLSTYFPRAKQVLGCAPLPADFAVDWGIVRDELRGRRKASVSVGEGPYGINSGAKNSVDYLFMAAGSVYTTSLLASARARGTVPALSTSIPLTESGGLWRARPGRLLAKTHQDRVRRAR
ncbi:hypothetical protein [Williamsia sp.]|uniref:hypothetical protein n=1 Tax=Williamsia sp. TaxID=1872085 RepID=UPI002F9588C0